MHPRQFVPRQNKKKYTRIAIFVVVFLVFFSIPIVRKGVRISVGYVGVSVVKVMHSVGGFFSSVVTTVKSKHSIEAENKILKQKIEELSVRNVDRDELLRENTDLKAAMGRSELSHFVIAAVIAKSPNSIYDTLVIDGGKITGMSVGQVVYSNGLTPIGTIDEVMPSTAIVRLYSAPGEKTEARLSPSNVDVTLEGRGGGNFSATVERNLSVVSGATVVTKELNPKTIALFQKTTSDPRDPFQTLILSAPVNFSELSFVEIKQ